MDQFAQLRPCAQMGLYHHFHQLLLCVQMARLCLLVLFHPFHLLDQCDQSRLWVRLGQMPRFHHDHQFVRLDHCDHYILLH